MALKPCRECKKKVSTEASNCPSCGAPDPTTNMNKKELVEWRSRENLEEVTFRNDEKRNEYKIRLESHDNGINKGYFVLIKKDTGELEMWFPTQVSIKASSQVSIQSYVDAKVFKGECVKIKRKNL